MPGPISDELKPMHDYFMNNWNLNPDDAATMVEYMGTQSPGAEAPYSPQAPRQFAHEQAHAGNQTTPPGPITPSGMTNSPPLSNFSAAIPLSHETPHQTRDLGSMQPTQWMTEQRAKLIQQSKEAKKREEDAGEHAMMQKELEIIRTIHQERQAELQAQMYDIFGLMQGKSLGELASPTPHIPPTQPPVSPYNMSGRGLSMIPQANSAAGAVTKLGK